MKKWFIITILFTAALSQQFERERSFIYYFFEEQANYLNQLRASVGASNMHEAAFNSIAQTSAMLQAEILYAQNNKQPLYYDNKLYSNSDCLSYTGDSINYTCIQDAQIGTLNINQTLDKLFSTASSYNYTTNTCAPGVDCTPYLMITQYNLTDFACDYYPDLSKTPTVYQIACYFSNGSYAQQKFGLQRPYQIGSPCQQCLPNYTYCLSNLCSDRPSCPFTLVPNALFCKNGVTQSTIDSYSRIDAYYCPVMANNCNQTKCYDSLNPTDIILCTQYGSTQQTKDDLCPRSNGLCTDPVWSVQSPTFQVWNDRQLLPEYINLMRVINEYHFSGYTTPEGLQWINYDYTMEILANRIATQCPSDDLSAEFLVQNVAGYSQLGLVMVPLIVPQTGDTSFSQYAVVAATEQVGVSFGQYYNYTTNTCQPGYEIYCRAHTTILNSNATKIGCGKALCYSNATGQQMFTTACVVDALNYQQVGSQTSTPLPANFTVANPPNKCLPGQVYKHYFCNNTTLAVPEQRGVSCTDIGIAGENCTQLAAHGFCDAFPVTAGTYCQQSCNLCKKDKNTNNYCSNVGMACFLIGPPSTCAYDYNYWADICAGECYSTLFITKKCAPY